MARTDVRQISFDRDMVGPRLPIELRQVGDGVTEAFVPGRPNLTARNTDSTEAIRELKRQIQSEFAAGQLGNLNPYLV